jgi:hypothetical protein
LADQIKLPTTWQIRYTDPIAPGQIVLQVLNDAGIQTFVFERAVFLDFAHQVGTVAAALRQGTI